MAPDGVAKPAYAGIIRLRRGQFSQTITDKKKCFHWMLDTKPCGLWLLKTIEVGIKGIKDIKSDSVLGSVESVCREAGWALRLKLNEN